MENSPVFLVYMGGSAVLSLPCTLAPRCTRRIRLAVKNIILGLSLVASWGRSCRALKVQAVHECNPSRWIGAGFETEEGKLTNPKPVSMALPHRPSLPFFPVSFFFRFLFFPLVMMIPCKFCE